MRTRSRDNFMHLLPHAFITSIISWREKNGPSYIEYSIAFPITCPFIDFVLMISSICQAIAKERVVASSLIGLIVSQPGKYFAVNVEEHFIQVLLKLSPRIKEKIEVTSWFVQQTGIELNRRNLIWISLRILVFQSAMLLDCVRLNVSSKNVMYIFTWGRLPCHGVRYGNKLLSRVRVSCRSTRN